MKSVMSHNFSQVPKANIQRSSFKRSAGYKTTFDAGYLVPFFVDEALPGDTFNCKVAALTRILSPLTYPVMDNLFMDFFFFAVPNRILWSNWEKFNGEQTNPGDSTDFTVPQVATPAGGFAELSLFDYMGLPPLVAGMENVNAFHSRAYNLIWNEWFRDENLQDSVTVDTGDGTDDPADYVLLQRGKRHDYFTSCLPWPQKGDAVSIPLGVSAPIVYGDNFLGGSTSADGKFVVEDVNGSGYSIPNYSASLDTTGSAVPTTSWAANLLADLTDATASTINELREAFQVQKLYERDARGGTRYIEIISSHFGVTSPDSRMQRPEYLGGGSMPIVSNVVAQNSESNTTPQGNLSAFAHGFSDRIGFTKSFTEHCTLIGLMCVRADLTYQQGIDRMWSRQTRWDFYWPSLAHIGEQAVLNKEIFAQGSAADDDVFGYQERFAEYRYKNSLITGALRSGYSGGSLDAWHLSQDFSSLPVLNDEFIVEEPPMARVEAVTTEGDFISDMFVNLKCARPMPVYSVPGQIDRF